MTGGAAVPLIIDLLIGVGIGIAAGVATWALGSLLTGNKLTWEGLAIAALDSFVISSAFAVVHAGVSAIKLAARGHIPHAQLSKVAKNEKYYQFQSQEALLEHLSKHGPDMGIFDPNEFLNAANDVIRNGMYTSEKNGYLMIFDTTNHGVRFAFVGMDYTHSYITTFGLRRISSLSEISWLIH